MSERKKMVVQKKRVVEEKRTEKALERANRNLDE